MTPSPLSFRAFVHRFFVALLIGVRAHRRACRHRRRSRRERQGRADPHGPTIDPSLLAEGRQLPDHRLRHAGVRRTRRRTPSTSASKADADRPALRHDHGRPRRSGEAAPAFSCRSRATCGSTIPGHGTAKINAAFAFGGPQLAITTIEQNFDIPISHYLEVDFAGFRDIVERDRQRADLLPDARARHQHRARRSTAAGCHNLSGEEALAYVRSRYYQYQTADGEWHSDPTSDLGRIHRQQYFMRSLAQRGDQRGRSRTSRS